jgi:hypothetical protein
MLLNLLSQISWQFHIKVIHILIQLIEAKLGH